MTTSTDFTVLSVLERRHIIETVQGVIELANDGGINYEDQRLRDSCEEDLQEILRILGADSVEDEQT
jgi:hypothetical protein